MGSLEINENDIGSMISGRSFLKTVCRILGQPNFLRWLQWPVFIKLLDVRDSSIIVDLGAGRMQYAVKLAKISNARIIAIDWDISPNSTALARRHDIAVLFADGRALPLADRSVDRILMSSLLQMVPEPEQLLAECYRVLKREGHMVLSVPNHYQFIPAILESPRYRFLCRFFKLPPNHAELTTFLNKQFKVGGKKGYYSRTELNGLLAKCRFEIMEYRYAPGWVGSLLWEFGVLAYVRFGNLAFHLLLPFYPIARLYDILVNPMIGSEHIVKVVPRGS